MGRTIPLGSIPDTNVLPDGIFRLRVNEMKEVLTKEREGKTQKLMYKLTSAIVEPAEFKNQLYFDNFVIGTDEDPDAEELATWQTSIGGKSLKRFLSKVGVPFGDEEDSEALCNAVKGQEFLCTVVQKVEPALIRNTTLPNPYAGRVNNNTTAFWALGEKDPVLTNGHATGTPAATTATKRATTRTTAAAKAAPSDEITCISCKKRVPRGAMKGHVEDHMKELQGQGADTGDE